MAATLARCANCGDPFERRQVTQTYCKKPDCRRAHNAANFRNWWHARNALQAGRHQAVLRSRIPESSAPHADTSDGAGVQEDSARAACLDPAGRRALEVAA